MTLFRRWRFALATALVVVAAGLWFFRDSQPLRFARLVWRRDSRCSVSDVWNSIGRNEVMWDRIGDLADESKVVESDGRGHERIETPKGTYWVPLRNQLALAEMLGEQEHEVYGNGRHGVRKGDVVLDCGANVGVFTRKALDDGARLVVAIELAPENIECLRRNFAGEIQAGRVIIYPKGVWNRDDVLVLRTYGPESGGDSVALKFPGSREGPHVPLTTIDKLVSELKLERVDFIKMDIEGAERQALEGARHTLARFHPRLAISTEHRPDDINVIPALIERLDPGAKAECGPCTWVHTALVNRVQAEVVYAGR